MGTNPASYRRNSTVCPRSSRTRQTRNSIHIYCGPAKDRLWDCASCYKNHNLMQSLIFYAFLLGTLHASGGVCGYRNWLSQSTSRKINPRRYALALQSVPLRKPHFQGWLVRSIDHDSGVSFMAVLGLFSPKHSADFSQTYMYLSVDTPNGTHFSHRVLAAHEATVLVDSGSESFVIWKSDSIGTFAITDNSSTIDMSLGDLRIRSVSQGREPWDLRNPYCAGPEGWLGRTPLLPCRYFVHSVCSQSTFELYIKRSTTLEYYRGRAFAHIEGNSGAYFPRGWIWSQGISTGGDASYLVVGGLFPVGFLEIPSWVLYVRLNGSTFIYRTTDFHSIYYMSDPVLGTVGINASSLSGDIEIIIKAGKPCAQFESPIVYCPSINGFQNSPGCRETFKAECSITYISNNSGRIESLKVNRAALEFGGVFQEQYFSNV